jgi:hypothetical protein
MDMTTSQAAPAASLTGRTEADTDRLVAVVTAEA